MKKVLNMIIGILSGILLSIFLLSLCHILCLSIWNIDILSSHGWNYILFIANNRLRINLMSGIGFISLLIGLMLIFFSLISISMVYVYSLLSSRPANKVTAQKLQKHLYQNIKNSYKQNANLQIKKHKLSKNIDEKAHQQGEQITKTEKQIESGQGEISLPKSIINSDAYSVVQKMQNNNQNPLTVNHNDSKSSVVIDEKQENSDTNNDELRRRILKKFNTSLEEIKMKKEPNNYKKEKKNE